VGNRLVTDLKLVADPAVRNDRIVEIKSALILQPGPAALTDGLDAILAAADLGG
jgi:iron complex transport system substrate-binding protein